MAVETRLVETLRPFAGLDAATLASLAAAAERIDAADGTILFEEGGAAERLYVIEQGLVELFTGSGRRRAGILLLWPGDLFMPAAALADEPYLLSARALGPARLVAFEAAAVRRLFRASLPLSNRLAEIMAGQFRTLVRSAKDLRVRSAPCRVGAFLLRLVDESAEPGFADLPVAKSVLASRLGLSSETFSRALNLLAVNGVSVRGSRVILTDRARLEAFCGPDPLLDARETGLAVSAV